MVRDSYGVGDDGQRGIHGASRYKTGGIDNIEIVQIVRFAARIEDARSRIRPHPASSILMAHTLYRNALFKISMKRHGSSSASSSFENIDPSNFKAFKTLHVVGRVRKLNAIRSIVGNALGFVEVSSVA